MQVNGAFVNASVSATHQVIQYSIYLLDKTKYKLADLSFKIQPNQKETRKLEFS